MNEEHRHQALKNTPLIILSVYFAFYMWCIICIVPRSGFISWEEVAVFPDTGILLGVYQDVDWVYLYFHSLNIS